MATIQKLTATEKKVEHFTLDEHAEAMRETMQVSYIELSAHIHCIHKNQKYTERYENIEDWASDEFGWSRQRIYEFLNTYKVLQQIKENKFKHLPANDYQARTLSKLDPDDFRDVWGEMSEKIEAGEKLTAKAIKQAISSLKQYQKNSNIEEAVVVEEETDPDDDRPVDPAKAKKDKNTPSVFENTDYINKEVETAAKMIYSQLTNEFDFDVNQVQAVALALIDMANDF